MDKMKRRSDFSMAPRHQCADGAKLSYFRPCNTTKRAGEIVIFPGRAARARKLSTRCAKVEEEMAWFDKYFYMTTPVANEALKTGYRLGRRTETKNNCSHGGNFGNSSH